jgi:hypothetical protein
MQHDMRKSTKAFQQRERKIRELVRSSLMFHHEKSLKMITKKPQNFFRRDVTFRLKAT